MSNESGRFEFVGLPSSEYALEVRMPGFKILKDTVAINGRSVDRNLELEVGELEETVTVKGGGPRPAALSAEDLNALKRVTNGGCVVNGSVGGKIVQPRMLFHIRPEYSEVLNAANIGGTVRMDATIGVDGIMRDVRATESPNPDLEQAAVEAVRQWVYSVTTLNCEPIEVHMRVTAFVPAP